MHRNKIILWGVIALVIALFIVDIVKNHISIQDLRNDIQLSFFIISGFFAFLSTFISLHQVLDHTSHWKYPSIQNCVIKILLMVPIYSMCSFGSVFVPKLSAYFDFIRGCYEAYVIFIFIHLMIEYLGGVDQVEMLYSQKSCSDWPFPLCCLEPIKPTLRQLKRGPILYMISQPLCRLIQITLDIYDLYGEGQITWNRGFVYNVFFQNISQVIALYCLVWLFVLFKEELKPHGMFYKFLSIKFVIFLTFWQNVTMIIIIRYFNIYVNVNLDNLNNVLICLEMFIASILHAAIKKWYDDKVFNPNQNLFHTFGTVGTMDLYWLARVLKSPLGGLPSQLSCIYVGNSHVVNYMRYLTTCMPYYDVVQIAVQDDIYTSKCIHVPKPPHPRTQKQNDIIRFFMHFYDYFEAHPSELISPLLFMSEICRYASSTVWDNRTDFLYWDRVINTHLDWRSFFYDFDSALRFLKEDDKIIPLVRYVSPTILNTPGLLVELAKRTACVTELKKYNRSFDSTDIKNELIDVMNSTSSHRLQRNIREVLTHCFMGWQSNDEESLPSHGKMAVARKSKIAVRPYLPRKAKADTHH